MNATILTLNAGSSSIKFSIYTLEAEPVEQARGQVESLGPAARLQMRRTGGEKTTVDIGAADHMTALNAIFAHGEVFLRGGPVVGVGHRITHGGPDFTKPAPLDEQALEKLQALKPLAPLHQPHNLKGVDAAKTAFPDALQVGCFDTSFHRSQSWVNQTFGLPRRYFEQGVQRYGFHGLSYDYITGELRRIAPEIARGRVVIAHLGNGASMCAVRDGRSVASSMGFSALDGLCMGTRCGQLDPGVMLYLMDQEGMSAGAISDLLYKESGLLGLSGLSNDMRELTTAKSPEAEQALAYYALRVRRELGALTALLGGLDAFVLSGGVGENSAPMRTMICEDMAWLGLAIDDAKNRENALNIESGPLPVMVVPTDEERVIARALAAQLNNA